jgi:Na+-translocating ferredoxin:NAD+ oxidoreductase RnfG subunit
VLSQNETPGLGTRIVEIQQKETIWDVAFKGAKPDPSLRPWFQVQFDGKSIHSLDSDVQAISGATITSRAVIESIRDRGREILEKISNGR